MVQRLPQQLVEVFPLLARVGCFNVGPVSAGEVAGAENVRTKPRHPGPCAFLLQQAQIGLVRHLPQGQPVSAERALCCADA